MKRFCMQCFKTNLNEFPVDLQKVRASHILRYQVFCLECQFITFESLSTTFEASTDVFLTTQDCHKYMLLVIIRTCTENSLQSTFSN